VRTDDERVGSCWTDECEMFVMMLKEWVNEGVMMRECVADEPRMRELRRGI
jgi:hypothetical protein